jgi:RNA-binding protein
MDPLSPSQRRELRARAHALHPVVSIGHHGLTPSVLHEIDVALTAHELIKVRVFNDDRREREALLAQIADTLDCTAVQVIGKLLVLWRQRPLSNVAEAAPRPPDRPRRVASAPNPRRRRGSSVSPSAAAARGRVATGATRAHTAPVSARGHPPAGSARRRPASARGHPALVPPRNKPSGSAPRGHLPPVTARGQFPAAALARPRTHGKSPAGVPRAAAPRRRRRSP